MTTDRADHRDPDAPTMQVTARPTPDDLRDGDALFLDFDGTLVEIAEHPERIDRPEHLPRLLDRVRLRLGGALALVSGRRIEDIDRRLAPYRFTAAGLHGLQLRRRPDAPIERVLDLDLRAANAAVRERIAAWPGVWLEDKEGSSTVHFRATPDLGARCAALVQEVARQFGLQVQAAKMAFELKAPGIDKGVALRALLRDPTFNGRRPIFVGDDVTDEDGFAIATELGGFGVRIGGGATAAQRRLADVNATLAWLGRAVTEHGR